MLHFHIFYQKSFLGQVLIVVIVLIVVMVLIVVSTDSIEVLEVRSPRPEKYRSVLPITTSV